MCGRVAQSQRLLASIETLFQQNATQTETHTNHLSETSKPLNQNDVDVDVDLDKNLIFDSESFSKATTSFHDNFNLSPGMSSIVFQAEIIKEDNNLNLKEAYHSPSECTSTRTSTSARTNQKKRITSSEKIWGLCPRPGSVNHPLPPGVSKHFSNLMYNARSDTLYEKKTFRQLALNENSCIWCIDGFFEWKDPEKNVLSNQSGKQPYFVHRNDGLPLIIPGLFTKVKTGRIKEATGEEEMIETFTLITTAACQPLKWLHHRQPCFIWDVELAKEWLYRPSEELVARFSKVSSDLNNDESCLGWHPVKKQMSKVSYRNYDSVEAIKVEKVTSVKSFFTLKKKGDDGRKRKFSSGKKIMDADKKKVVKPKINHFENGSKKNITTTSTAKNAPLLSFLLQGSPAADKKITTIGSKPPSQENNVTRPIPTSEKKGSISYFFAKHQSKK